MNGRAGGSVDTTKRSDREPEPVLDPDLEIVDPHHHLWDRIPDMPERTPYEIGALHADIAASGHRVVATVNIQANWNYRTGGPPHLAPVGETEGVVAQADSRAPGTPDVAGIVGFADPAALDTLDELLDAHTAAAAGRFRGIRRGTSYHIGITTTIQPPPRPDTMAQPEFRAGVRRIVARGLTFETFLFHPQIAAFAELARALPDTPLLLDHLGFPLGVADYSGRIDDAIAEWRGSVVELARCENVLMKLGGIGTEFYLGRLFDTPWPATSDQLVARWGEPIRFVIEQFGADRCMFESNFPVDRVTTDYRSLWNAFKRMTADASASERTALFSGTARRYYRL
jgi:predicted TIM-barrel fold metal-dependent hydrolase